MPGGADSARRRRSGRAAETSEYAGRFGRAARDPLLRFVFRSWLYRKTLGGPAPDRVLAPPEELRPALLAEADAILKGRFRLAGETLTLEPDASPFDAEPPTQDFAETLHGFAWLRHLAAAGGAAAPARAKALILDWLSRYERFDPVAWSPQAIGRRTIAWCTHARFIISQVDILERSRFLLTLTRHARHLQRVAAGAPPGPPRMTAAIGLAISGAALDYGEARLARGLKLLEEELRLQVLPDGGHATRAPDALLELYADLAALTGVLAQREIAVPPAIERAMDRMAPMLRFFRHGDGRLAVFNGGREGDGAAIEAALARDAVKGRPPVTASFSGYQRLTAGRSCVIAESGPPPPPRFAGAAHAGCLSFEFSVGGARVVVNCGPGAGRGPDWALAMRATAAHSTLTLADTSSAVLDTQSLAARLFGPRVLPGPRRVTHDVVETDDDGLWLTAAHDGYLAPFGWTHERRLFLDATGLDLRGEDRLVPGPEAKAGLAVAVRFHIHPEVRLSRAQAKNQALLRIADREAGWKFLCEGADLAIEDSVYLGAGPVRRCEQIVLGAETGRETLRIGWALRTAAA